MEVIRALKKKTNAYSSSEPQTTSDIRTETRSLSGALANGFWGTPIILTGGIVLPQASSGFLQIQAAVNLCYLSFLRVKVYIQPNQ